MNSIRTTVTSRLLRSVSKVHVTRRILATQRWESSVPAARGEHQVPAAPRDNGSRYGFLADKATSNVQDGSEPDILPAGLLSGAPSELQARTVRIYRPSKTATQSGNWGSNSWRMDWDVLGKGHRWENALMGWQSSGDFVQGTHLSFKTKDNAIAFAEKQGYEYFVQEPNERRFSPKAYANNFLYSPAKLKHIRTK